METGATSNLPCLGGHETKATIWFLNTNTQDDNVLHFFYKYHKKLDTTMPLLFVLACFFPSIMVGRRSTMSRKPSRKRTLHVAPALKVSRLKKKTIRRLPKVPWPMLPAPIRSTTPWSLCEIVHAGQRHLSQMQSWDRMHPSNHELLVTMCSTQLAPIAAWFRFLHRQTKRACPMCHLFPSSLLSTRDSLWPAPVRD